MASSRRTAVNENISTYGNATRNYTSLATWEAATDIDLVTATQSEVLECYDDAASFDDSVNLAGATTNVSYFRIIRPASGEGHDGTPNNGVFFSRTTDADVLIIAENHSQIQDLIGKLVITSSTDRSVFVVTNDYGRLVGCIAFDSSNAGSGGVNGFTSYWGTGHVIVNCLAHNISKRAFNTYQDVSVYFYNCTADTCTTCYYHDGTTNSYAKNCIATNCAVTFSAPIQQTTCTTSATYVNSAGDDFHLAANDEVNINTGTDLSDDAIYPFDDDIDGETRS